MQRRGKLPVLAVLCFITMFSEFRGMLTAFLSGGLERTSEMVFPLWVIENISLKERLNDFQRKILSKKHGTLYLR